MPYNRWYNGDPEYLSFVSIDNQVGIFQPGERFQVLAGTYKKENRTLRAKHVRTGEVIDLKLDNITPLQSPW